MKEKDYSLLLHYKDELMDQVASLRQLVEEAERQQSALQSPLPPLEISLPNAFASLEKLKKHVEMLRESLPRLEEIKDKLTLLSQTKQQFKNIVSGVLGIVSKAKQLVRESRFDEALGMLKAAEENLTTLDLGMKARVIMIAKEIFAHQKANAYAAKGDARIAQKLKTLEENEKNEYMSLVDSLPCDFIDPADKAKHRKIIERFTLFDLTLAQEDTLECLDKYIAAYEKYVGSPDLSDLESDGYAETIRIFASATMIELFKKALEQEDDNDALALFERKRPYLENLPEILAQADNEEELRRLLLINRARRMDSAQFQTTIESLAASNDPKALDSLAAILSIDDLEATKRNILVANLKEWSFDKKATVYSLAIKKGMSPERAEICYEDLITTKPRKSILEDSCIALLALREVCPKRLQKRFAGLLRGFTRSPQAKKAKTKSAWPEFHSLFGEKDFAAPIGKPVKKKAYPYWSAGMALLYVFLILILPLAVAGGGYYLIFATDYVPEVLRNYQYAIPLIALLIPLDAHLLKRWGRDEKVSIGFARAFVILSFLLFATGLAYYIIPDILSFLAPYSGSAIAGGLLLLLAFLPFSLRSKAWKFVIVPLTAATGIAAIVFLVLSILK